MQRGLVLVLLAVGCRDVIGIDDPVHEHPVDAALGSGSGSSDATASRPCPPGCTSCDSTGTKCTIDCRNGGCGADVTCPAGVHCEVLCDTDGACFSSVDCRNAQSCSVTCSGVSTCGDVRCGAGECDVTCSGLQSCMTVSCNDSCSCEVECPGPQSCQTVTCTSALCDSGSGCSSSVPACHSCL